MTRFPFPKMARVRQNFAPAAPLRIPELLQSQFAPILPQLKPGATIAVGVGSRGISNLAEIVRATLDLLRAAGAKPFIFPAMGSHGGASPGGQTELLASYGVTESAMDAEIRASMEVRQVGKGECGAPVYSSIEALGADHIILVNRIKPHTDFYGTIGSGLVKMSVIGLGKKEGAAAMHIAATRLGHERVIRDLASVVLRNTPILCGIAILENQRHETASIQLIPAAEIEAREPSLLEQARALMPRLPFEEIDLLIVDYIGKNVSGAGLDPNVTGRWVNGYSSALAREGRPAPFIRRIFVRDLTAETHGNAIGIGLSDFTTARLAHAVDPQATYINALTAMTPQAAKIPIYFQNDCECIERALTSLALNHPTEARVVRIKDTLSLETLEISENLLTPAVHLEQPPRPMAFDPSGNLVGAMEPKL